RAVCDHLPGVEGALVPGKALDNDTRLLVEQDAHAVLTPCPPLPSGEGACTTFPLSGTERGLGGEDRRAATTFSAASESVSAVRIGRPLSVRMRRPSSTLVPASRTTSGTGTCTSRTAWSAPRPTQSQPLIPQHTFTRTARQFLAASTRLAATGDRW